MSKKNTKDVKETSVVTVSFASLKPHVSGYSKVIKELETHLKENPDDEEKKEELQGHKERLRALLTIRRAINGEAEVSEELLKKIVKVLAANERDLAVKFEELGLGDRAIERETLAEDIEVVVLAITTVEEAEAEKETPAEEETPAADTEEAK